jgi:hypothetical protein
MMVWIRGARRGGSIDVEIASGAMPKAILPTQILERSTYLTDLLLRTPHGK